MFGDRAFKEDVKVKWDNKDGTLMPYDWCPYKKRGAVREVHLHTQKPAA